MHSKSDDIEIMSYDEIIFRIDFSRYQRQMRGSSYFFNCVNSMDFRCHKRNFRRGSYIDTSDWIKKKKRTNKSEKMVTINISNIS